MAESKIFSLAVIGGGAAGVMAASHALTKDIDVLLLPGSAKNKKRSRAFWVARIENMPGLFDYKKAIDQPNRELLKELETIHPDKFVHLKNRGAESVEKCDTIFKITDSTGHSHLARKVLIATGVMDVQPHFNDSIKPIFPYANVQIVDYCLRCDGHHVLNKKTSVIGHDLGAAWVAIMLYERYKTPEMKILTHGKEPEFNNDLWELLEMYGIEVIKSEIKEIKGNPKEMKLEGYVLDDGTFYETQFSFISLGMILYNELAKTLDLDLDKRGFVITDQNGKSSMDGVYVAGDLRAQIKNQVYTAWDSAVDSVEAIVSDL